MLYETNEYRDYLRSIHAELQFMTEETK